MAEKLECLREELEQSAARAFPGEEHILVHGEGAAEARVMLIGEAPGETETRLRRPFVGKAGKNLDEFLALAGLDRGQLYVSNVVKFRPTKISAAGNRVNRPPNRREIDFFLPSLLREIALVNPEVVVTLGNVPLKAVYDPRAVIGDLHGRMLEWKGRRLYPLYHPASVIYNRGLREVYLADVRGLSQYLL